MLINASKFQLAILLVHLPCLLAARPSFDNCSNFMGLPLQRKCIGRLTKKLHRRFHDSFVSEQTPYAIYAPNHLMMVVFVTMFPSPLMACSNLTMLDFNLFRCNSDYNIKFALSRVYCYNQPLNYVGELKDECMGSSGSKYLIIRHSVLHYADIACMATVRTAGWWLQLAAALLACVGTFSRFGFG